MASIPHGSIARVARPIHGEDELDQLLDLIGQARIIMFGEATHGTHELYDLRASLTRKLIRERGFAAVAIDADWPDALRVDRYVRNQSDDESAEAALDAFDHFPAWRWRNEDVATFVDWLRYQNCCRRADTRAGFYGLDLYSSSASMRAVLSYLEDLDPGAAASAREYFASEEASGRVVIGDELVDQLVEMQWRRAARSGRAPSGDAWFHAMQSTQLVKHAGAYYGTLFGSATEAWNLRSRHLADTLEMLANQLGTADDPAKLVVWAPNRQIGDLRGTSLGETGRISLGQLVRERHPDETALVGFTTHTGTLRCADAWDEPAIIERLSPSPAGSWEAMFHEIGIPRFMLTASAIKRTLGEHVSRPHRSVGIVYRSDVEDCYDARIADHYDVIVHVDTTRAVEPLAAADADAATHVMHEAAPGM
jgi:erythromycin esterase-like protein